MTIEYKPMTLLGGGGYNVSRKGWISVALLDKEGDC